MWYTDREYGNDTRLIRQFHAIVFTDACTGDHLMCFHLPFVDMAANLLAGSDSDKMKAELSVSLLGRDNVL